MHPCSVPGTELRISIQMILFNLHSKPGGRGFTPTCKIKKEEEEEEGERESESERLSPAPNHRVEAMADS